MRILNILLFCFIIPFASCANDPKEDLNSSKISSIFPEEVVLSIRNVEDNNLLDTVTFGAGCFWCIEAVFVELKGVTSVTSGYMGGSTKNPTYKEVCTGRTGHAEVAQIIYNPEVISFTELLEVFWQTHDPTTLNRQGNDVGTQYRSAIFYHNNKQKETAEFYKNKLIAGSVFSKPIVTEISPLAVFYPAENYHQDYFANNPSQPYCQMIVKPKVEKFKKAFSDKLK